MSEVARREDAHVVAAVPVPQMLQELGVRIGRDESSGLAVVMVPDGVREKMNVINPVTSFAQANPNWTPSISVVKLDKAAHTYRVSGKNGLNKQALETLAHAGGIIRTDTRRLKPDELGPDERWGFEATVTVRRGDGQPLSTSRSRIFNEVAERGDIEDAVRTATVYQGTDLKFPTLEAQEREIEKRWRTELQMGPAKTESKAINRAIRAALQIPTSLADKDLEKPFLVIGYSFTPDYDDVEVKRILVAAGLNAQHDIYGPASGTPVAEIASSPTAEWGEVVAENVDAGTDEVAEGSADAATDQDQQADAAADEIEGAAAASVPGGDDDPEPQPDEPEQAGEQSAFQVPDEIIAKVEATTVDMPSSAWSGQTLAEIGAAGEKGDKWLGWALRQPDEKLPGDLRAQVHAFVKARKPELWNAYSGSDE